MPTVDHPFRCYALASLDVEMARYDLAEKPFEKLAETGFTHIMSGEFLGARRADEYADAIRAAGLGLVVGVPTMIGAKPGPFMDAWGSSLTDSKRAYRNKRGGANMVWDWWDASGWALVDQQARYAKQIGATGIVLVTSMDQASWPVYWDRQDVEQWHYWCWHPIVQDDFALWALRRYGIKHLRPARTPEEDLEHAGMTFEYCADKLAEVLCRMASRCAKHVPELMVCHQLGRPGAMWEWAGGRVGLLDRLWGGFPPGQWLFVPQVYTNHAFQPHQLNVRHEAAIIARRTPWNVVVGAEFVEGMAQGNASRAVLDGFLGVVMGPNKLFAKGTNAFDEEQAGRVRAGLSIARRHWGRRPVWKE